MIISELAILGGLCGFAGLLVSLICVAMVAGFLRSTHTVQYLPHDNTAPTDALKSDEDLIAENEAALLNKVGRKKKKEEPTVVEEIDAPLNEILQSDLNF